jgi:hypothetical protein
MGCGGHALRRGAAQAANLESSKKSAQISIGIIMLMCVHTKSLETVRFTESHVILVLYNLQL